MSQWVCNLLPLDASHLTGARPRETTNVEWVTMARPRGLQACTHHSLAAFFCVIPHRFQTHSLARTRVMAHYRNNHRNPCTCDCTDHKNPFQVC